jgi:hypothetical protein
LGGILPLFSGDIVDELEIIRPVWSVLERLIKSDEGGPSLLAGCDGGRQKSRSKDVLEHHDDAKQSYVSKNKSQAFEALRNLI